jgi:hypothetical protein
MRIMFLPPTLTPRRSATNILAEDFNPLRMVKNVSAGEHEKNSEMRRVLRVRFSALPSQSFCMSRSRISASLYMPSVLRA